MKEKICPVCNNANEHDDYQGPACTRCDGVGFVPVDRAFELAKRLVKSPWVDVYTREVLIEITKDWELEDSL